jgi:hypothetical protein
MGRMYLEQLQGRVFSCRLCGTHLASNLDLISKVRWDAVLSRLLCIAEGSLRPQRSRHARPTLPSDALQSFHSRQGKAYLFNEVVNVSEGPKEERLMTTGK